MPLMARTSHRTGRSFVVAVGAVLAFSMGAGTVVPAHAQMVYGTMRPSVTINYNVLDRLGPPPRVPDGRFVLHGAPTHVKHIAFRHSQRPRVVAERVIHHPVPRVATIVRIGSVTIDYAALPRVDRRGPRIVLRRPGTPTLAAAVPAVERPEAPRPSMTTTHATSQVAVVTPPERRAPPPPAMPSEPRVATMPAPVEPKRSDLSEFSSLVPMGGVALAATRSPTEPVSDSNVLQSSSRVIRFAPGTAALQDDAPAILNRVAQNLKANPQERIALVAYASGDADQAIEARRVSLARAVMVRAYLIEHGVASTRIEVRAMGNRVTDGGSADRVDLVTTGR